MADVLEILNDTQVTVTDNSVELLIESAGPSTTIEVGYLPFGDGTTIPGPVGPAGPTGPQGPPGNTIAIVQSTPSASWVLTHNLGHKPQVSILDESGNVIHTDVTHFDTNRISVVFAQPQAGSALLT
ncbi:hypothetical protein [Streptosporangium subroseum]|uniref:hypothetical protein n=1 Tax=Streptosporangium subroseum TaxID=106412 RepID=UPI00308F05E3|nr:hypothetical protein OHB15_14080 [Streptosporangium subroseum]